jgi:hypothetical protein
MSDDKKGIKQVKKREFYEFEKSIILSLTDLWDHGFLSSIIIECDVCENYYILRNTEYSEEKSIFVNSKNSNDIDGALLDILLFRSSESGFLELNIVRMDTKPLLFPNFIKESGKLDYLAD